MNHLALLIAASLGTGLPVAASAETANQSDLAYCNAMSDIYARYIGHGEFSSHYLHAGSAEGYVAIAQCRQGNAKAAIPALERALRDAKFTLPPRG